MSDHLKRTFEKKRTAELYREKGEYIYKVKGGWKIGIRPPRKTKTKSGVPIVYGDRTCRRCKGICHDGSYRERSKWKDRKGYYCSKTCLKMKYRLDVEKIFKKGRHRPDKEFWKSSEYKKHEKWWLDRFERVDCITR
jgi:hypothetical protein